MNIKKELWAFSKFLGEACITGVVGGGHCRWIYSNGRIDCHGALTRK